MTHFFSIFSRKYRPLKWMLEHACVDLSQMLDGKVLQISGGESVSNEQSLPPNPWSHVQLPEMFACQSNITCLIGKNVCQLTIDYTFL